LDAEKRKRDSVATRASILEAARDVFASDGYDRASIRKIASRAGCTHGTLYLYFRDKDDLLYELIEDQFRHLQSILRAIPRTLEPVTRLREAMLMILRFGLDMPDHYHVMMAMRPPHLAASSQRFGPMADEITGVLFDLVVRATSGRQPPLENPRVEAAALLAIVHGVVELSRSRVMDVPTAEAAAIRAVDLLIAGLRVEVESRPRPPLNPS
jgi:AcrR family transcriptional regulator